MAFTNPKENLKSLQLSPGMIVADFGSGGGAYTFAASKEVADGRVYAIDIQKNLLDKIQNEALARGLLNIEVILADLERAGSTNLKDAAVDVGIVSNILFAISKKETFVEEIKRVLRPGGSVLVVDWSDSFGGLGPQRENIFSEEEAQKLFKSKGFNIVRTIFDAGEHHYGFVAQLER